MLLSRAGEGSGSPCATHPGCCTHHGFEARGHDHAVEGLGLVISVEEDPLLGEGLDPLGPQRDVVAPERRVEVVAQDAPLAAGRIPRQQLLVQVLPSGQLPLQHTMRDLLQVRRRRGIPLRDRVVQALVEVHAAGAVPRAVGRHPAEEGPLPRGDGVIVARDDPSGRALRDGEVRGCGGELRGELRGRGAGADQADALAGEAGAPVPSGRVHDLALEVPHAFEVGGTWLVQLADR